MKNEELQSCIIQLKHSLNSSFFIFDPSFKYIYERISNQKHG